jgi:hypothetical protein
VCGSTILLLSNCGKTQKDYVVRMDFVYTNQTEHTLQFVAMDTTRTILPNSTNNTFIVNTDGPKQVNAEQNAPSALAYLLRDNYQEKANLCIDGTCVDVEQEGFVQSSNYQYEVLGDRHIRYTYTFTDADIDKLLE